MAEKQRQKVDKVSGPIARFAHAVAAKVARSKTKSAKKMTTESTFEVHFVPGPLGMKLEPITLVQEGKVLFTDVTFVIKYLHTRMVWSHIRKNCTLLMELYTSANIAIISQILHQTLEDTSPEITMIPVKTFTVTFVTWLS